MKLDCLFCWLDINYRVILITGRRNYMENEIKLDKLQEEVDNLSYILFEDEKECIRTEAVISKQKSDLLLLENEAEIKTNAMKNAVKIFLECMLLGTIPIAIISLLLSSNILFVEIFLILISSLKAKRKYDLDIKELNILMKVTNKEKLAKDIMDSEDYLYQINQKVKLNEKKIASKKTEIKSLFIPVVTSNKIVTDETTIVAGVNCRVLKKADK